MKLDVTAKQIDDQVGALRDTISKVENGQRTTYPFDVALSHQLYTELFGPFAAAMPSVKHLIFEPDGAMLRLPINLLVMDQASVDAYKQRATASDQAAYDFRGVSWLGRDRDISTSVSPRSFAQLRAVPPSAGRMNISDLAKIPRRRPLPRDKSPPVADRDCILPLSSWAHPISAKELEIAAIDPSPVRSQRRSDRHPRPVHRHGDRGARRP